MIEAKPADEEESVVASTSADETPAENETPTETNDEAPAETHAETAVESSKESSSSESSEESSNSKNKVISAPVSTKKPWTIKGCEYRMNNPSNIFSQNGFNENNSFNIFPQ